MSQQKITFLVRIFHHFSSNFLYPPANHDDTNSLFSSTKNITTQGQIKLKKHVGKGRSAKAPSDTVPKEHDDYRTMPNENGGRDTLHLNRKKFPIEIFSLIYQVETKY